MDQSASTAKHIRTIYNVVAATQITTAIPAPLLSSGLGGIVEHGRQSHVENSGIHPHSGYESDDDSGLSPLTMVALIWMITALVVATVALLVVLTPRFFRSRAGISLEGRDDIEGGAP